jgi:hypothetical protein
MQEWVADELREASLHLRLNWRVEGLEDDEEHVDLVVGGERGHEGHVGPSGRNVIAATAGDDERRDEHTVHPPIVAESRERRSATSSSL